MEPLFIKKPTSHIKEAAYRLGRDVDTWEQDIVEKLHQEHPYLPDYDIKVELKKRDADSGAGVGQVTVNGQLRLPVIINDYRLAPLDLMFYNSQLLPVTQTSIDNITQGGSLGKPIKPVSAGADMGLRGATTPPSLGKYAECLQFSTEELQEAVSRAYTTNELAYEIKDSPVLRSGLHNYIINCGHVKEASTETQAPRLEVLHATDTVEVGHGPVLALNGAGILHKLSSIEGALRDTHFFVSDTGNFAVCKTVPGTPVESVKLASAEPKGLGTFVCKLNDEYVAMEPVHVLYKTAERVVAVTSLGERVNIHQKPGFSGWCKIANDIYASDSWEFVPLTNKISFGTAQGISKVATFDADITVTNIRGNYLVRGDLTGLPELAKIADTPVNRVELQNGFTAYCTPEQVEDVIQQADRTIAARIKSYHFDEDANDMIEVPKIAEDHMTALMRSTGMLTPSILKHAEVSASAADKTVDTILGLNFLNKENIYRMLEGIDDLEVARAVLARVLLAGRFGLDIDVGTVRTAVFALDAVIKDLRRLRQTHLVE